MRFSKLYIVIIAAAAAIFISAIYVTNLSSISSPDPNLEISKKKEPVKAVILAFDDSLKSQFTNGKPILDKYGFKGSFLVVCNWIGTEKDDKPQFTWDDIEVLVKEAHDIQSHGTFHEDLKNVSQEILEDEIINSKKCFAEHGIETTVFSTPRNNGWNNATIIETIAEHYDFAITGFSHRNFMKCDGWRDSEQTNCKLYKDDGTLNYANRYTLKNWNHNGYDRQNLHNNTQTFSDWVAVLDNSIEENYDGNLNLLPIIVYHKIDNTGSDLSTDIELFEKEMKYLHDNDFTVFTLSDLAYDEDDEFMYIKKDL